MFARCTIIQGQPDEADLGIKIMQEQILPAVRELDGFQGLLSFIDRDSGKGMSFTLWETAEARQASVEAASSLRKDAVDAMTASVVGVENYELVVDER